MSTLWKMLVMVHQCSRRAFWLRVVYVVLQSLLPLAGIYVLKLLVDNLSDFHNTALYVVCYVAIFFFGRLLSTLASVNNDILSQRLVDYISDRIQRQSSRLDLAYYDNPAFHDTFHRAQQESSYRPLEVLNNFMALFGSIVTLAGVVVLLGAVSGWVILLMVAAVLPSFFVRLAKARRIYTFRRGNTQVYRRTAYYSALLTHRDFAKEVRQYGLSGYIRGLYVDIRRGLVVRLLRISRRLAWYDALCAAVESAALLSVLLLFVQRAYVGAITVGSFVMLFEAFRRGQSSLQSLVRSVAGLYDNRLFAGNLFEFLALEPRLVSPSDPMPFPEQVDCVEFRNVSFRYPDMDRDVLTRFSLTARRGTVCHIEGENGYGKSTLMKLLMRFYDPDDGVVCINGIDIRRFDLTELRRHIGVLFQDFVRYHFTASDNIAFGDITAPPSRDRVVSAARQAGVEHILESLPDGYDTMLGRLYTGGEELSMGQWQRVALARLYYSDAPILILDEPTAWMDVTARAHFDSIVSTLQQQKLIFLIQHI
ncbi:MAG: multidrug ABC transporter ATPase/permease [bacterium P3]|nr:MAG: multidrug ABC transporter ATPase/permease [bacterium P3]KWW41823.1 MAG: multidrug ABC transporter ATPase/permease [bacterium F083]